MSSKNYSATGYGSTQTEARRNAEQSILTDMSIDKDMADAVGSIGIAFLLALGYIILAWELTKAAFFRLLPALIVALVIYTPAALIWRELVTKGTEGEAIGFGIMCIFFGSIFSGLLSQNVGRWTLKLEWYEARAILAMPSKYRRPVTTVILLTPAIVYVLCILSAVFGDNLSFVEAVTQSATREGHLLLWATIVVSIAAGLARNVVHPLADLYTWRGIERDIVEPDEAETEADNLEPTSV